MFWTIVDIPLWSVVPPLECPHRKNMQRNADLAGHFVYRLKIENNFLRKWQILAKAIHCLVMMRLVVKFHPYSENKIETAIGGAGSLTMIPRHGYFYFLYSSDLLRITEKLLSKLQLKNIYFLHSKIHCQVCCFWVCKSVKAFAKKFSPFRNRLRRICRSIQLCSWIWSGFGRRTKTPSKYDFRRLWGWEKQFSCSIMPAVIGLKFLYRFNLFLDKLFIVKSYSSN